MYTLPRDLSYYDPVDVKLFEGTLASDLECLGIGGGNLKLHFIVNNKNQLQYYYHRSVDSFCIIIILLNQIN